MNKWSMIGKPVKEQGFQYDVVFNDETKIYAINSFNTANAGKPSQVRVSAENYQETGLPNCVKKIIRNHQRKKMN